MRKSIRSSYYCTGIKAGWRQAFDLQCHDRDDFKLYRDYGCPDDIYQQDENGAGDAGGF